MRSAVFLERDGILNLAPINDHHQSVPRALSDFQINRAAAAPLNLMREAGLMLIVVTNQPGVSRGYLNRREVDLMHLQLMKQFKLDDLFMCTHDEMDYCTCHKPAPGLFREAAFKYNLDLDRCFVVSDKASDAQAAQAIGCTSLLVESPLNGDGHHDCILPDLDAIAQRIVRIHAQAKAGFIRHAVAA